MPKVASDRTRVLFLASHRAIGADTSIHILLLSHLSRERCELRAASQTACAGDSEPAATYDALAQIPDIDLISAHFGPSLSSHSRRQKLKVALQNAGPVALSFAGLVRYVRQHRIQIIHATDRPRDAISCVALAAATGAKSLIHVHVKYGDWMSRGVQWAFGRADALVGVSRFVADSLVDAGYESRRTHAVLNAIEPERWDPGLNPEVGRASLGVEPSAPLILSVARLFHWKGHDQLIRALALVARELPAVRLAIVGADYPEGSGTTQRLTQLAHELGIGTNVMFTGRRSDIAELLAASDVFALPSFEEPFGLVYAEAMAMKRPVVGLTNGGTPEVVDHGKSGLLSEPGDTTSLANNLSALLRDAGMRQRFGEYGRRQVEARFHAERMARDFEALYAELRR